VEKSPAFQFYPKDFLTDANVVIMNPEVKGLYITLLCIDWIEDGFFIDAMMKLAGFDFFKKDGTLRDTEDYEGAMAMLSNCFVAHPEKVDFVTNPRLMKERKNQVSKRRERSESGKKGAKSLWSKRKNEKLSHSSAKGSAIKEPMAIDGSSSSSSSSSNKKNYKNNSPCVRTATPSHPAFVGLDLYESDEKLKRSIQKNDLLKTWVNAFPGISVADEIKKAHAWEKANPTRRKKDRPRFLTNWMSRAQDRAPRVSGNQPPSTFGDSFWNTFFKDKKTPKEAT